MIIFIVYTLMIYDYLLLLLLLLNVDVFFNYTTGLPVVIVFIWPPNNPPSSCTELFSWSVITICYERVGVLPYPNDLRLETILLPASFREILTLCMPNGVDIEKMNEKIEHNNYR